MFSIHSLVQKLLSGRPEMDACSAAQLSWRSKFNRLSRAQTESWNFRHRHHDRLGYWLPEQRRFLGYEDVCSEKKRPAVSQRLSVGLSLVGFKQYPSHHHVPCSPLCFNLIIHTKILKRFTLISSPN